MHLDNFTVELLYAEYCLETYQIHAKDKKQTQTQHLLDQIVVALCSSRSNKE